MKLNKIFFKKATKSLMLFSVCLSLVLLATERPLKGEDDVFKPMGVIRLNKPVDAPDFTLSDLEGTKRSLGEFRGKFILLNFWATW